jgi:signal transduction histidine kinase
MSAQIFELPLDLRPQYVRVLSEVATLLLRDGSPDDVARQVFSKLSPILKLDAYFHYLVTPDGSEMELQSCAGATPDLLPQLKRLKLGQAVCGTVAQRCEFMYVPDVQQRTDVMTDFIRSVGIRCYLCQPLIDNGHLLGTFSFGSKRRASFTEEECQLLYLVAQQVALASARRQQSARLRQMEKLALAGRLAASLSHEINNPLESILNILFLLKGEQLSDMSQELVDLASHEVVRIRELTKQSLGVHRAEDPKRSFDMQEMAEMVARLLRPQALQRDIRIDIDVPEGLTAFASANEVQQILINLVKNAIEAVGNQGNVTIAASRDSEGRLEIMVSDSGPGMPPEIVSRVFEPFFTTKADLGTGLGLWVTQQLVRKNQGEIRLASSVTPPTGTSFRFTLPTAAAVAAIN